MRDALETIRCIDCPRCARPISEYGAYRQHDLWRVVCPDCRRWWHVAWIYTDECRISLLNWREREVATALVSTELHYLEWPLEIRGDAPPLRLVREEPEEFTVALMKVAAHFLLGLLPLVALFTSALVVTIVILLIALLATTALTEGFWGWRPSTHLLRAPRRARRIAALRRWRSLLALSERTLVDRSGLSANDALWHELGRVALELQAARYAAAREVCAPIDVDEVRRARWTSTDHRSRSERLDDWREVVGRSTG
jgi:hypothetical protein